MTIAQAAKHLGINPETLRTRIRREQIGARKDAIGRWRVDIPGGVDPVQPEPVEPGREGQPEPGPDNPQSVAVPPEIIATMQRDHAREAQELHVLPHTSRQNERHLLAAGLSAPTRGAETGEADGSPPPMSGAAPAPAPGVRHPPPWWRRLLGLA